MAPWDYGYDGYEERAATFVIYLGIAYRMMPEDIAKDHGEGDSRKMMKISKKTQKSIPGIYKFQCYYVEC